MVALAPQAAARAHARHCRALAHTYASAGVSGLINKHVAFFDTSRCVTTSEAGSGGNNPKQSFNFNPLLTKTVLRLPADAVQGNKFYHTARSMHGCVYFKLLDDAAFFAAQAVAPDFFILTTNFSMNFMRPVTRESMQGKDLVATGSIISASKSVIIAEAVLVEEASQKLVAKATGSFMRGRTALREMPEYAEVFDAEDANGDGDGAVRSKL